MAVSKIISTTAGNVESFQGLSTDDKPVTNIGAGSTFYELDTKKAWVFDAANENPLTSNGWWEV